MGFLFLLSASPSNLVHGQLARSIDTLPRPSPRQLAWHSLEYYAFVHFGLNTFSDKEWGYGDESPSLFNPAEFDADRIVRLFRDARMHGVILTAKHHDGFCLWPSSFTEHSVKNSPWKNGNGDIVREFSEACRRFGLSFGVYLSPWDRNHKDYGRDAYIEYYRSQLRELLTDYGEIFEVWFDGANGGDGFYGGAREKRTIDRRTYYDWPSTWGIVRDLQPNAVMFSDIGPDVRWVGNEQGFAGETNWSTYSPIGPDDDAPAPGHTRYAEGVEGHSDGTEWIPAECDVSIRPGWFYHPSEDTLVKIPLMLMDLYLRSVGRNASFLLNVPLNRNGLISAPDSVPLMEFRDLRDAFFSNVVNVEVTGETGSVNSWVGRLDRPATFNAIELGERIKEGQRVEAFVVDVQRGEETKRVATGTTIGRRRILLVSPVTADRVRLTITRSKADPRISHMRLYNIPADLYTFLRSEGGKR